MIATMYGLKGVGKMETIMYIAGIGTVFLAWFAIHDLRNQSKKRDMQIMYYCNKCEQFNTSEECPICLSDGAKMPRGKAEKFLFEVNANRMNGWISNNRIMPECE